MNGMLASVTSVQEAKIVMNFDVDIIDIKNPSTGALGAQPIHKVKDIVGFIDKRRMTSATIGDVKNGGDELYQFIMSMAETGVDFVKVGLFDNQVKEQFLMPVKQAASKNVAIVIVLFAEDYHEEYLLNPLLDIGLKGVMIDTRLKNEIGLCNILSIETLTDFTYKAKHHGLLTGLAGSLRSEDIPQLLTCHADYLGFRGALCVANERRKSISQSAIKNICDLLKNEQTIHFNENHGLEQVV